MAPPFLAQVSFNEQQFYDAEHFLSCRGGDTRAQGLDRLERIGLYWCRNFDRYFAM
jgi:hypothetical protein